MQLENVALWIYNRFSIRTVPYYSYRVKNCDTVVWPGKLLTLGHSAYKTQAWVTNTERKTWLCMKPWHFLICFPLQTIQIFGTPPPARSKIPYQNSVNNMSFSCLLIIELFWANLLRFCNWGYKVQRRCSGVTTSWGLFFLSPFSLSLFRIEVLKRNNKTSVS